MTKKQKIDKSKIKKYWETRLPQTWYSDKILGSREWFNEIEYKRYNIYYEFFPQVAEFEYHSGERVLEVGVGIGTDLVQYAKKGAKVSGIDLTKEAVETTKKNFKLRGLEYEVLKTGDAEKLPFKDNSFDLICSYGVLHHTPNTDKAVEEIYRVLKPGGKSIVLLYARGWKHYFKRIFIQGILLGKLFKQGYNNLINNQTEVHGGSPLTYVYKKKEIKKMFDIFGEVNIERHRLGEYIDYAPYGTKKVPIFVKNSLYFLGLEKIFGEDYIIKAEKREKKERHSFLSTLFKP